MMPASPRSAVKPTSMTAGPIPPDDEPPHAAAPGALAQASVQTQTRLFQLLANSVPAMIAYFSTKDFRCRFANKRYAQTFGRDEESILGCTLQDVIGVEAAHEIQPHVDRMLADRTDRKSTRLNSSHSEISRMPSSA